MIILKKKDAFSLLFFSSGEIVDKMCCTVHSQLVVHL